VRPAAPREGRASRPRPFQRLRSLVAARYATHPETFEPLPEQAPATGHGTTLRLLSYNIQAGIPTGRYRDYLTRSWQHVLPSKRRNTNLDRIARLLQRFDLVGLQEVDGGSLRSGFINQAEYLAKRGGFPSWYLQLNRDHGQLGQHSNALLSRLHPSEVTEHRLPGLIPGRGLLMARFGHGAESLILLTVHLALGRRARRQQLEFIAELVRDHRHVIVMGDMNSRLDHWRDIGPLRAADLHCVSRDLPTYPSWRPLRCLDHILVGPTLRVERIETLHCHYSDHLPIGMEVRLPDEVKLSGRAA